MAWCLIEQGIWDRFYFKNMGGGWAALLLSIPYNDVVGHRRFELPCYLLEDDLNLNYSENLTPFILLYWLQRRIKHHVCVCVLIVVGVLYVNRS